MSTGQSAAMLWLVSKSRIADTLVDKTYRCRDSSLTHAILKRFRVELFITNTNL